VSDVFPSKRFGQHFLKDKRTIQRIIDELSPKPDETIVEIGPGRGSLTALLAERASRLVLVEYDRALAALLRDRYASMPSVTIVERDVLSLPLADIVDGPFKLVGNVPYYITTPILFHALVPPRPTRAVYLVQREVADRIVAKPGSKEYGALSVNVQAVARPAQLFRVPAGAFQPPPRVDSAVIRIEPRDDPAVAPNEEDAFRRLVQDAFGMRRKQLRRVLRSVANLDPVSADRVLSTAEIDPVARPETLSPDDFARLLRIIHRSPAMNSE
jgi:16S rRNA (adenine1518-N6/adenine1519-N6)-dimethyltransferase